MGEDRVEPPAGETDAMVVCSADPASVSLLG
jgi:hypothetical protein